MYRSFATAEGGIMTVTVGADYQAQEGDLVTGDYPTEAEVATAFPAACLAMHKARARAQISAAAEAARLQFVTPGSAKAMAYQEKAKEAVEFRADPEAGEVGHDAALYPLIYAEVGTTASDAAGVAAVVFARYMAFKDIEAQIGGREAAAQKAVKDAIDIAAIEAVLTALAWPTPTQGS